jgi:hypothetical protein
MTPRNGVLIAAVFCSAVACVACMAVATPNPRELVASWRVAASNPVARIELRADRTCSTEPAFEVFAAACNSRSSGPSLTVRTCHWGLERRDGADEIQVVLDSTRGFLALKMTAERLLGPGVLQLKGTCVDHSRYTLAP